MKIKYVGGKVLNYTFMGRVIPNTLTEIDPQEFFGTKRYSEKEIIAKLKDNKDIECVDIDPVIEKKIKVEIEEKKTEVTADPVKVGIEFELDTRNQKRRGKKN